ncbi:protein-glutamate O-methyltransferase CheR [Geobacter sp. DSM 9736]|uniref:CheR family methyltransferase n=1 Tax=Geobacter sp. DSM 9736 TaxID=1277350 RepID=UPI000B51349B|nr:protein-glutamate O-methyltransferase [Geobacter sp. DSM 9736]SNB44791.1 MCP methyltransferase, CheR-type [Geobacter sp. DSM 9736]
MSESLARQDGSITLTRDDFSRLSEFIYKECGIKMPPAKKTMLEARLQKRLRVLGMPTFKKYCDYLFSSEGMQQELVQMIDLVTTNKTDFFREPDHFDYLTNHVLPKWMEERGGNGRRLMIWSAGCSTGEEPYTLAMVLEEFAENWPGFSYQLLATDISTRVLEKAKTAIYDEERVIPVPMPLKRKYLLRSKDRAAGLVRIVPELRSKVSFRRLNFMDSSFGIREHIDIIFCRNVIIYFDRPTQKNLLSRFIDQMHPGGYLFMGHSETLNGLDLPLLAVHPTVYRKPI